MPLGDSPVAVDDDDDDDDDDNNNNNNNNNNNSNNNNNNTNISHLLYMDDLKLIAKSEEELQKLIKTVKIFSDDINIEFGLAKCAKITFKRDKLTNSQNLVIDTNREIQELEHRKTYKYLGI